ncbi:hypothetical protein GCM10011409_11170 [Lentibacillus populi]|uniref:Uncharacterized protein n=1 Tax=Lentibacillus populi TaxID=1827502 RepID=A0A9W5TVY1_9BACI|nr:MULTISPECIES: hypothetical protein [Bacillaceae]MBT2215210.1 hypothetical protein [Virgibacillus dakarensis]GGB35475.1 hypothetical protein GCM10011409_11170 [Lentibacillus populi]
MIILILDSKSEGGGDNMKKVLIALFLVLILGFGIIGYTQTISKPADTNDQNRASLTIQS